MMDLAGELKKAVSYHQAGRLDEARAIYVRIHEVESQHPDPLHLLGVIAYQTGEYHDAVKLIKSAIGIDPGNAAYYNNLGNAYKENDMLDDAVGCYQKAIDLRPEYAEAYFGLGNAFQQLERFTDAVIAYQKALIITPDMAIAHNNLGVALFNIGRIDTAFEHYQQALQIEPGYFEAYNNAGNALKRQERFLEAIRWYRKAIELNPNSFDTYASMGFAYQNLGQLDDAVDCLQKALEINPDYGEAYNDLGTLYRELGKLEPAMACFQKSAILRPKNPEAFNNMGIVYRQEGRFNEAIACYHQALQQNPDFSNAHYNLGSAYWQCGQSEEALASYCKAIQLNPDHAFAHNLLISRLQQTCAWSKLTKPVAKLKQLTKAALKDNKLAAEMPFLTFSLSDDPGYNFKVAKSWADDIKARISGFYRSSKTYEPFSFDNRGAQKFRITVGYLSADFQNHATAHLMRSFFGYHDRNAFKINAYSYGKTDSSHYREKIENDCDKFVDIGELNHFEAANEIYKDEVEILVDLKGYTEGNRLEICAHQPAPIQVAWLGFPGTSGADFMDYIITDRIVTPPEHASYFSEKFVYMPHTYQVNDGHQEIADKEYRRSDFDLPEDGFIFCSFNEPYKIEPVMFDVWMNVLRQIPNSVLWLIRKGRLADEHLKSEAIRREVAPDRLIFTGKLPKAEHLARIKLADLFLDTRTVNGHTTTSDALWAGVPVITLQGKHFASRVSSSLLAAAGLSELITQSLSEYEALAVRLANHPGLLNKITEKLTQNRLEQPLFDTARFTRDLENAYKMIWQLYLNGEKPRLIKVPGAPENN